MIRKNLDDLINENTNIIQWFGIHHYKYDGSTESSLFGDTFKDSKIWAKTAKIYQALPLTLFRLTLFNKSLSNSIKTIIVTRELGSRLSLKINEDDKIIHIVIVYLQDEIESIWNKIEYINRFENSELNNYLFPFIQYSTTHIFETVQENLLHFINDSTFEIEFENNSSWDPNLSDNDLRSLIIGTLLWPWETLIYDRIRDDEKKLKIGFVQSFYVDKFQGIKEYLDNSLYWKIHYEGLETVWREERTLKKKALLKTAIISILIDSYAHNISAHSLAALKWWVELRNKILDKRFKISENGHRLTCIRPCFYNIQKPRLLETTERYYGALGLKDSTYNKEFFSLFDFLQFMEKGYINDLFSWSTEVDQKGTNSVKFHPRFPVPIDYALFPFFRFLRDKGAFWSGVTRDMAFGGETITWYKILWEDFANNPLYLGTISKTEGITKINVNLAVKENEKWFSGRFLSIDLGIIDYEAKVTSNNKLEFEYSLEDNQLIIEFLITAHSNFAIKKLIDNKLIEITNPSPDDTNKNIKEWLIKVIKEVIENKYDNVEDLRQRGDNDLKHILNNGFITYIENLIKILNSLVSYIYFELNDNEAINCDFDKTENIKLRETCQDAANKKIDNLNYSKYAFIKLGKCFSHFREILSKKEFEVFLPGGIIGEHALFTVFENTIRNIKHYKDSINEIKWNGIDFWISIEKKELIISEPNFNRDPFKPKELFKVSTWLGHKTELLFKNTNNEEEILWEKVTKNTLDKILDYNGTPRMGGNSQDKACAAMLFNNLFTSVEDRGDTNTDRKMRDTEYFPWVHFNTSDNEETYKDDNDHIRFDEIKNYYKSNEIGRGAIIRDYKTVISSTSKGYLKKTFFLWNGADYIVIKNKSDFYSENISRFKFVLIDTVSEKDEIIFEARKNGVVRLLYDKESNSEIKDLIVTLGNLKSTTTNQDQMKNEILKKLYFVWLTKWLKESYKIGFFKVRKTLSLLDFSANKIQYLISDSNNYDLQIALSHGGGDEPSSCNVRSHGAFWNKYYVKAAKKAPEDLSDKKSLPYDEKKDHLLLDLIEVLGTKLVIFDDRINDRMSNDSTKRKEVFENQLQLFLSSEISNKNKESGFFKKELDNLLGNTDDKIPNVLVIHLTYIETLGYQNKLNEFIEKEIYDFILRENFILVITTGRGRISWQENLKKEYKFRTIFKPVESLLNAIENGISYNDNFDVKYNLVKVIFGS